MKPAIQHISVLIPACDEEALLPRCLRSVLAACQVIEGRGVVSEVIVVSDHSQDRTAALARELLREKGVVVSIDHRSVGTARAFAARLALGRPTVARSRQWLANTDADCEVPPDWLQRQLALAEQGWMAIAGIVDVDCFSEHESEVAERFRRSYRIHADGTHPHVHGANLGVRADAYVHAGGWSALESAEDHDLWNRLGRTGCRRLSDAALRVLTSGRRVGRAPRGFAGALAAHNARVA